jgi:hypothetical protein
LTSIDASTSIKASAGLGVGVRVNGSVNGGIFAYYDSNKSPLKIFEEAGRSWSKLYEVLKKKATGRAQDLEYIRQELLNAQRGGGKLQYLERMEGLYQEQSRVKSEQVTKKPRHSDKHRQRHSKAVEAAEAKPYDDDDEKKHESVSPVSLCNNKSSQCNPQNAVSVSSTRDYNVEDDTLSVEQIERLKEIAEAARKAVEARNEYRAALTTATTETIIATGTVTSVVVVATATAAVAATETSSVLPDEAMAAGFDRLEDESSAVRSSSSPLFILAVLLPIILIL